MKWLLTLRFDGSAYCGYQVQPNGVSVQQKVQDALEHVYGTRLDVVGCSRTDSGVHALDFKLTYQTGPQQPDIPPQRIPYALNACLPSDIAVQSACRVRDSFHVRHDLLFKEYVYLIHTGQQRDPFLEKRALHVTKPPELTVMQRCAAHFIGEHDFSAFMAAGSDTVDTVRRIYEAEVTREGELVRFRVRGSGFLYHMVRIMTGTLLDISAGRITEEKLVRALAGGDRAMAGFTAPAHGLYLYRAEPDPAKAAVKEA